MGKPSYNFGKTAKEKAKQQKQMEKALKRRTAKQNKDALTASVPDEDSTTVE